MTDMIFVKIELPMSLDKLVRILNHISNLTKDINARYAFTEYRSSEGALAVIIDCGERGEVG